MISLYRLFQIPTVLLQRPRVQEEGGSQRDDADDRHAKSGHRQWKRRRRRVRRPPRGAAHREGAADQVRVKVKGIHG